MRKDILQALRKAQPALKSGNINKIKVVSNMTLHNAGLSQDQDSVAISVIIYTLSKIYNRPRLHQHPGFLKFKENVLKELREAQSLLHSNDVKGYHRKVKRVFQIISAFEKKFGMYMREAILQSKIKRGGRIVEHGISVGRAAQLLGISRWELMSYIGGTKLGDIRHEDGHSVSDRLEATRRIFSL